MPLPYEFEVQEIMNRCFDSANNRLNVFPRVGDDEPLNLGADGDGVEYLRSTALGANTALTGVLVGTVVGLALEANTLIISNITGSGDVAFYWNRGGNSEQFLMGEGSDGIVWIQGVAGGIMLALAAGPPAPDVAAVHIWNGSAGAVAARAGSLLTLEATATATYLQFLTDGTVNAGISVGNPGSGNNAGEISYLVSSQIWRIFTATAERLRISANAFAFQEATTISSTSVGQLIFNGGLMIGANAAANQFDDANNGAASTTMSIGNATINVTSDVRVKENIVAYAGNALALLRQLQVKEFDYLDRARPFGNVYTGRYVGFTAQDLFQTAPWSVNTQGGADCWECRAGLPCEQHLPWQARQEFLIGPLVKAVQELDAENRLLRVRVAALEGR